VVGNYPYGEDGLLLWESAEKFHEKYVSLYYTSDADVAGDSELQVGLYGWNVQNGLWVFVDALCAQGKGGIGQCVGIRLGVLWTWVLRLQRACNTHSCTYFVRKADAASTAVGRQSKMLHGSPLLCGSLAPPRFLPPVLCPVAPPR
jgi:hypothetical protein